MSKSEGLMPPVHPGEVLREDFMKPLGLRLSCTPAGDVIQLLS
jgi:plasmid maintenance system antidote protein VapI